MKKPRDAPDPCARASTFEDHARHLHARAKKAHAQWIANLSQEERAKLREMHLDAAPDDNHEVGGHSPFSLTDIADSPLAKCEDNIQSIDSPEEKIADRFGITQSKAAAILQWHRREIDAAIKQEKAYYLQIIVGGLLASKNPKLNSAALAFATNLDALNGLPCQREYARQNHISPSAISKVVKAWEKSLDLAPSAHQKSKKACQVYSQVGKSRHCRGRKIQASTATALLTKLKKNTLHNPN
jgi:hypothetical protein